MKFESDKLGRAKCILVLAVMGVCIGRAYQCLFWDIPIRSLLWNEDAMSGLIQTIFHLDWDEYLKHPKANNLISGVVSLFGWSVLLSVVFILQANSKTLRRIGVVVSSSILVFIAALYHLEKFRTVGQFFEYSLQFMTPLLFLLCVKDGINKRWLLLAKISVALTFVSHGLYAVGFYPVPGNFVAMTINILHCQDATALTILQVAGILDIIASIGLFLKGRIFKWSLLYCVVWGGLTAVARVVAHVELDDFFSTMHQWAYETVYRTPHFLIPLALWTVYKISAPLTSKG